MKPQRPAPVAMYWGALWGAALGIWLLGGRILEVHHVDSASAAQWVALDFSVLAVFAFIGAGIGFEVGLLLLVWETARGTPFRDRNFVYALAMPALLPLGYLAFSAASERMIFGQVIGYGGPTPIIMACALSLAWSLAVLFIRRMRSPGLERRRLEPMILALAFGGAAVLPMRTPDAAPPKATTSPALEPTTHRGETPMLFVGIDSGNWRVFDALIESGKAPYLASLVENGASGDMHALWPPFWSAPAWAAIVTGYPPEESGIFADLTMYGPGLPPLGAPLTADVLVEPLFEIEYGLLSAGVLRVESPPRTLLRRDPFWAMLTRAGARTAVVRFNFTYPARGEASYMVSDHAGSDEWAPLGVLPGSGPDLVFPPEAASSLMASFSGSENPDPRSAAEVLGPSGNPLPRNAHGDPVDVLPLALETDQRVLDASDALLRDHSDLDLLAVYLKGFDVACHALWPYRFPEDFPSAPPPQGYVRALGPVMDRYVEFLDRRLASLAGAFSHPPNIVIVADHGAEASDGRKLWWGWHSERGGLFLAAGPSVAPRAGRPEVTYFDVAPTVLDLLGYRAPWLRGQRAVARRD